MNIPAAIRVGARESSCTTKYGANVTKKLNVGAGPEPTRRLQHSILLITGSAVPYLCAVLLVWRNFGDNGTMNSVTLSIYFLKSLSFTLVYSSSIYWRVSASVLGNLFNILYLRSLQTFSIGFKSGEFAGHVILII